MENQEDLNLRQTIANQGFDQKTTIDFGMIVLKILEIIIVKVFTLPFLIYKNSLITLSSSNNEKSDESVLSLDFPLYVWYISMFNAFIVLSYPIGLLFAIFLGTKNYGGGFSTFLIVIIATYFAPLYIALIKEILQIPLKAILYLKIISNK